MSIHDTVVEIERKKLLKALDNTGDGSLYDGEVEALLQTLKVLLKQPSTSRDTK